MTRERTDQIIAGSPAVRMNLLPATEVLHLSVLRHEFDDWHTSTLLRNTRFPLIIYKPSATLHHERPAGQLAAARADAGSAQPKVSCSDCRSLQHAQIDRLQGRYGGAGGIIHLQNPHISFTHGEATPTSSLLECTCGRAFLSEKRTIAFQSHKETRWYEPIALSD